MKRSTVTPEYWFQLGGVGDPLVLGKKYHGVPSQNKNQDNGSAKKLLLNQWHIKWRTNHYKHSKPNSQCMNNVKKTTNNNNKTCNVIFIFFPEWSKSTNPPNHFLLLAFISFSFFFFCFVLFSVSLLWMINFCSGCVWDRPMSDASLQLGAEGNCPGCLPSCGVSARTKKSSWNFNTNLNIQTQYKSLSIIINIIITIITISFFLIYKDSH